MPPPELVAGSDTLITALALCPSSVVAVIVTSPTDTAVTTPFSSTVAILSSELSHVSGPLVASIGSKIGCNRLVPPSVIPTSESVIASTGIASRETPPGISHCIPNHINTYTAIPIIISYKRRFALVTCASLSRAVRYCTPAILIPITATTPTPIENIFTPRTSNSRITPGPVLSQSIKEVSTPPHLFALATGAKATAPTTVR